MNQNITVNQNNQSSVDHISLWPRNIYIFLLVLCFFLIEYTGELRIIVLRRKKDPITKPTPHLGSE